MASPGQPAGGPREDGTRPRADAPNAGTTPARLARRDRGDPARQVQMFESLNALGNEMTAIPAAIILEDGLPLATA